MTRRVRVSGSAAGINLAAVSDLRVGMSFGHLDAAIEAGDPQLPELSGGETRARLQFRHDGQDSPVVPSRGVRAVAAIDHILTAPDLPPDVSDDALKRRSHSGRGPRVDLLVAAASAAAPFSSAAPARAGDIRCRQSSSSSDRRCASVRSTWASFAATITASSRLDICTASRDCRTSSAGGCGSADGWKTARRSTTSTRRSGRPTSVPGCWPTPSSVPTLLAASIDLRGGWRYYIGVGRLF